MPQSIKIESGQPSSPEDCFGDVGRQEGKPGYPADVAFGEFFFPGDGADRDLLVGEQALLPGVRAHQRPDQGGIGAGLFVSGCCRGYEESGL